MSGGRGRVALLYSQVQIKQVLTSSGDGGGGGGGVHVQSGPSLYMSEGS